MHVLAFLLLPLHKPSCKSDNMFALSRVFLSFTRQPESFCPLIMTAGRPKQADLITLYGLTLQFYWDFKSMVEGLHRKYVDKHGSGRLVKVSAERDVVERLLKATRPAQIVDICKDAFTTREFEDEYGTVRKIRVPHNWPISGESKLPSSLSKHAAEFIAAKNDPRFPKSSRPTNLLKQLWFLSRALAGAVQGIKTRTAINLIGAMRPEESFELSRGAKRKRSKRKDVKKNHEWSGR